MANKQTDVRGTHFPSCGPTQRAATVLDVKAVVAFYSVGKEE
jgi:hypothetical protein